MATAAGAGRAPAALFFDVFGTVVDWRSSVAEEAEGIAKEVGVALDSGAFALRWRSLYQVAMAPIRDGDRDYVSLDVLHRENLDAILPEFGLDALDEEARSRFNRAWHRLKGWPDSTEGIRRLKQRHITAALSNGNTSLMVDVARYADLDWDVVLGADPAQQFKPHPSVYLTAAAWLDLEPEQCMMVAAHNHDLKTAEGLGFRTAFVRRPTEYGTEQETDLRPESDYDVVCDSLTDLADQLADRA
jgi:2-haloacid dehalogenase